MGKLRVLYITSMFGKKSSSASIRNVALVNGLAEIGHDVKVHTISYPMEVLDNFLISKIKSTVTVEKAKVKYISAYIPSSKTDKVSLKKTRLIATIKAIIKGFYFFPDIDKKWINYKFDKNERFDLVISSSDTKTSHFLGRNAAELYQAKWLQIWGDPWTDDISLKSKITKFRAKRHEYKLLQDSNYACFVSLPTLKHMRNKYPAFAEKMFFCPRSYFMDVISDENNLENESKIINFSYTGVLTNRSLLPLLKSIQDFNLSSDYIINFNFYGRGDLESLELLSNTPNCFYHGEKSFADMPDIYRQNEVLVMIGNPSGTQIPGKLYDYFATDRKIVCLLEDLGDDVAAFIESTKRCYVFKNSIGCIDLEMVIKSKVVYKPLLEYSPEYIARRLISELSC